jgi:hypothetical protein
MADDTNPVPSTQPTPYTRPAPAHPAAVDLYAILSYTAGLGGFAAAIGVVSPTDQRLKLIVASLAGISFLSGLALRVFYHQSTPPTN